MSDDIKSISLGSKEVIGQIRALKELIIKNSGRAPKYLYANAETVKMVVDACVKEGIIEKAPRYSCRVTQPTQIFGMLIKEYLGGEDGIMCATMEEL